MFIITFVILLSLVFLQERIPTKTRDYIFIGLLTMIIVLRYGIGADYFSYQLIYESVDSTNVFKTILAQTDIEPLFMAFMYISKVMYIPYHVFILTVNLISLYFTYKLIDELSPNKEQSYLVYYSMFFLFWNLSAIRQGLIITILLYVFFSQKFSWKSKTLITIAMFYVHMSAIIIPVVYLISKIKWNKYWFTSILLISPLFRLLFNPNFMNVFANVPGLSRFVKYFSYESIQIMSVPFMLRLFLALIILITYDQITFKFKSHTTLINFTVINLLMYFYIPGSRVMGTRSTIFGYYLMMLLIPMIMSVLNTKKFQIVLVTIFLAFNTVLFTNEMYKQIDRTGFNKSVIAFNFETVFNGDISNFSNDKATKLNIRNNGSKKNITKEYEYNGVVADATSGDTFLPMYFKEQQLYGIINTSGDVVFSPSFITSPTIVGDYFYISELTNNFLNRMYFSIITKNVVDSHEVKSVSVDLYELNFKSQNENYNIEIIETNAYTDIPLLETIPRRVIKKVEHFYRDSSELSYYKISTSAFSYFIVTNNNEIVGNKIYETIQPFNEQGYMIGTVSGIREYIDLYGNTFWVR